MNKEFKPRPMSIRIREVKGSEKRVRISQKKDWNNFWILAKAMGFKSALRYQLGIAQLGVDFWHVDCVSEDDSFYEFEDHPDEYYY